MKKKIYAIIITVVMLANLVCPAMATNINEANAIGEYYEYIDCVNGTSRLVHESEIADYNVRGTYDCLTTSQKIQMEMYNQQVEQLADIQSNISQPLTYMGPYFDVDPYDPNERLYSGVVSIVFKVIDNNNSTYLFHVGTGFMADDRTIITAAHVFYGNSLGSAGTILEK